MSMADAPTEDEHARICLVPLAGRGLAVLLPRRALAEDGYDLWLRYRPVEAAAQARYRAAATAIVAPGRLPDSVGGGATSCGAA